MSRNKYVILGFVMVLGLAGVFGLLWLLSTPSIVYADPVNRYVTIAGNDTDNDCTNDNNPCRTIQHAANQADSGDSILVATGIYSTVYSLPVPDDYLAPPELDGVVQVVCITKTITIQGGYTTDFSEPPDPETNPTTLDAHGEGRGVLIVGEITTTIEGLRITGGDATGLYGVPGLHDGGGGLYSSGANTILRNNQLFSNTAPYGGGLYLSSNFGTLNNNTIFSNTANSGGGARINYNEAVTLTHNTIQSNTAHTDGGGLTFIDCGDCTISFNTIVLNTSEYIVGGLLLENISGTISGNTIISNTTTDIGGGVWLTFSDYATLFNNTISGNSADHAGGLRIWYSDATLFNNTINANTAASAGGIEIWRADPILDSNLIIANTATDGGGCGLYLADSNATLINNVITDNSTPANTGYGVSIYGDSPHLLHNTIARNGGVQGYGVGVSSYLGDPSSSVFTNTILTGHKWGISVSSDSTASLEGTLWDNTFDWHGDGTILTGTHNYWGDPHFDSDGYHLLADSPAIDVGVDAGVVTDIDGNPRPMDEGYDIGADEFSSQCMIPLEGVDISGPTFGFTETLYTFTAVLIPVDATLPITYTWSPEPESGQGTSSVMYTWDETGEYMIDLAASNCGGSDETSHTISIVPPGSYQFTYLPLVIR